MKNVLSRLVMVAALCMGAALATPAQAQLDHSWVASNGDDSHTCDRAHPCATFGNAFGKTAAGGEIRCLDAGEFGGLYINKSITVDCEDARGTTLLSFGRYNFEILVAASDVVTIRGIDIDESSLICGDSAAAIRITGAGTVHIQKSKLTFRGSCSGVAFKPTGSARLNISDSTINNNGNSASDSGVLIRPSSGGSANVSIDRTELKNNVNGIFVDGSGGGGAVNLDVRDSVITNSSNGVVLASSGQSYSALIERTTINSSIGAGVAVSGAAATVRISDSTIFGNVTGLLAINGGNLRSFKNNRIKGNGTDGTPIAAVDALD